MYVYVTADKTERVEVEPTDTIHDLMEKMEEITGTPPILQRLITHHNGQRQLYHDEAGTLADHGIDESTATKTMIMLYSVCGWHKLKQKTLEARGVNVDVAPAEDDAMQIVVRDHLSSGRYGQEFTLHVRTGDTVASVMAQVQRRLGYPADLQELINEHTLKRLYHDTVGTLEENNVKNGSTLFLNLSHPAAIAADVEERKLKKAKEIAARRIEDQKINKEKEVVESIDAAEKLDKLKDADSDIDDRKLKKAKGEEIAPVQTPPQQLGGPDAFSSSS
ncbi:hypothetical protein PR202_ga07710 [Eleusine coracana subsp. coracana]|uniref:Ubiquitin-like domain-containing protein n=1 Tax=Eleusine coracana subsp. coracana TaxID=191504 RepID=A0AAV5C0P4_ELECO|nr:hypothetical protein PR202_ga07710 [Eleusine coracana subsp. coracana]